MNLGELKRSGYVIYQCTAGSVAYGLNTPDSDADERGIFVLQLDQRLSILDFDQEIYNDSQDIKYYDIKKFIKLAMDCNPNIIELLYIPKEHVQICTPTMQKLIDNRDLFISQKAYHTYNGYAYAQIKKCRGQNKLVHNPQPKDPPKKEDYCWYLPNERCSTSKNSIYDSYQIAPFRPIPVNQVGLDLSLYHVAALEHVSNAYRLYWYGAESKGVFRGDGMLVTESIPLEDEWERCCGLLIYNQHEFEKAHREWKQYWEWMESRNQKRWIDQENKSVDYDVKNMMHCFRLLIDGVNILEFGHPIVKFTGAIQEFLMDIRNNKFTYDQLMVLVDKYMAKFEELKKTTKLPWGADTAKINKLYLELVNS